MKANRAEHLRIKIFVESLGIVAQMLCPYSSFTVVLWLFSISKLFIPKRKTQ
jgi:hypothetical protein